MTSGKLDEELVRMDGIIRNIKPGDMLLMNESFQSTNEREGSEICHQVTKALIDNDIEVMIVTHLYAYAISFRELEDEKEKVKYLRAERTGEGVRTFRMVEGEPLATVFGGDIYKKIFEKE
jgi:DNA mismatch repair ATPase MutS